MWFKKNMNADSLIKRYTPCLRIYNFLACFVFQKNFECVQIKNYGVGGIILLEIPTWGMAPNRLETTALDIK